MVPLVLMPLLTRYLEPAEYGQVAIFQSLYVALAALVTLEVVGGATLKYFQCDGQPRLLTGYVTSCLQIIVVSGLVCAGLIAVVNEVIAVDIGLPVFWLFASLVYAVSAGVIQLRLGQWQARGDALPYGLMQSSQALLNCLLSILLVAGLSLGVDGRLAAMTVAVVIPAFIAVFLLGRDGLLDCSAANGHIRIEALKFGIPLIPHALGGFLFSLADRLVIATALNLEQAGLYSVAMQLSLSLGLVFAAVNNAYAPWLYGQLSTAGANHRLQLVRKTYLSFGAIGISVALVWLSGPWILRLLAGSAYDEAANLIGWLAIGQGFVGMYFAVVGYMFFEKKTALISACSVVTGVASIFFLIVAVRHAGVEGAAKSFAFSMGVRFLVFWWAANRCHPMPWFSFWRIRDSYV
jgi:O-antigen/teichoic acid export membrane protein